MANLYRLSQYFLTTLSVAGGIDASQTTDIVLQAVTGIDEPTKPGVALLNYSDPLETSACEWITYTSVNTTTKELQGVARGQEDYSAKAHSNGVTVAFPLSKSHINNIVDKLEGLDTGVTLDSPTLNSPTVTNPTVTGTPVLNGDSAIPFYNDSMSRQAIINGNFDVWQRGTSIAMTTANAYTADRWYCETATAGTDKTVSRQDGTGVNGSYYCARVAMVQDVDELLTFSQALESQDSIKFRGKKLTLSFYARGGAEFVADNATLVSKIVTGKGTDQKVLAFTTSADAASQNNTLTTSWQKFTVTTTDAIAADITQIGVSFAFTHAGSGTTTNYFEVTQVQLCAGEVALPFQPKSFDEDLRACQRYYEPIPHIRAFGTRFGSTTVLFNVPFIALKRNATWDYTLVGTNGNQFHDGSGQLSGTISVDSITKTNASAYLQVGGFASGTASRAVVGFSSTSTFLAIDNEI
jgi:hypothetical protein